MLPALAGGILIGLAAVILYGALGKVAGISGIAFGALQANERAWRLAFLAGLIGGAWIAVMLGATQATAALPRAPAGIALLMSAGLLVGAGTRMGNGCTSGHGICGLAQLSRRSLAAVAVFLTVGMGTATLLSRVAL